MKLIEVFDAKLFKDPLLADAILALLKLQDKFEKANQGNVLAGHLIGLSQAFRDESTAILSIIDRYQLSGSKRTEKSKPREKVKFVKPSNIDKEFDDGECLGCGKSKVSESTNDDSNDEYDDFEMEKLKTVKSFRDVLNAFMNDSDQMREFLKMRGVSVGNLNDPIELSKKVYDNLQEDPI